MRTRTVALALAAVAALAPAAPALQLFPNLPPLVRIAMPDLKIGDIDVCYDPLGGQIFIDVDVENRGTRGVDGDVRLDVYVEQNGTTRHVSRTVRLRLNPGDEASDVPVGALSLTSTDDLLVTAVVDEPGGSFPNWRFRGDWSESNESNNTRLATFWWVGGWCGYEELG